MKKIRWAIMWAMVGLFAAAYAADPSVTVHSVAQRAGTKLVDISYSATDADGDDLNVTISVKDGSTVVDSFSGSDGANQTVLWNAGAAWSNSVGSLTFHVVADDTPVNLIINGDFAAGDLSGWQTSGFVFYHFGFCGFNTWNNPPNGGRISQSIDVAPGHAYTLEFDYGKHGGAGTALVVLNVRSENGDTILNTLLSDNDHSAWESYAFEVESTDSIMIVSFTDSTTGGAIAFDPAVDNISLTY